MKQAAAYENEEIAAAMGQDGVKVMGEDGIYADEAGAQAYYTKQ
jgi:hypothetical protein